MHPGSGGLERIDGPVPAISRFDHDLRIGTGPVDHRGQPVDVVDDAHRLQHLTGIGGPHDHTAAPMQIDTHKLLSCVL
jgi:hypothetical protein